MFSGTVHTRDRLHFGLDHEEKVTAISVFDQGTAVQRRAVSAGEIAKLRGLGEVQIGDRVGEVPGRAMHREFPRRHWSRSSRRSTARTSNGFALHSHSSPSRTR